MRSDVVFVVVGMVVVGLCATTSATSNHNKEPIFRAVEENELLTDLGMMDDAGVDMKWTKEQREEFVEKNLVGKTEGEINDELVFLKNEYRSVQSQDRSTPVFNGVHNGHRLQDPKKAALVHKVEDMMDNLHKNYHERMGVLYMEEVAAQAAVNILDKKSHKHSKAPTPDTPDATDTYDPKRTATLSGSRIHYTRPRASPNNEQDVVRKVLALVPKGLKGAEKVQALKQVASDLTTKANMLKLQAQIDNLKHQMRSLDENTDQQTEQPTEQQTTDQTTEQQSTEKQ